MADRGQPARSSRPRFTAAMRGLDGATPQLGRAEDRRGHEGTVVYRTAAAVARVPGLRTVLGAVPPRPGGSAAGDPDALLASPLYERLLRVRASDRYARFVRDPVRRLRRRPAAPAPAPTPAAPPAPGATAPARSDIHLGPWASRRTDEALAFLRRVPFDELQRRGWHLQPNHFYVPLNDVAFLRANEGLWHDRGLPQGVDWDLDGQLELARTVERYRPELDDVSFEPQPGPTAYIWNNGAFSGADAIVYYGLVRDLKPRRVVEVGSGWSSLLLARALERNGPDAPCDVTLVEPFPNEAVFAGLPDGWEVHRQIVQHADLGIFERLQAGDVCFYDGSHCVRTGGDVNWFLFEVMPRLAPGVLVQIHDIFLPDDYHDEWVYDEGLSWNEQYLVQAFLMHNDAWRVRIANHMLWRERPEALAEVYDMDGGSLWLERVK
jgi:predicted O-methyltransferase YrrM